VGSHYALIPRSIDLHFEVGKVPKSDRPQPFRMPPPPPPRRPDPKASTAGSKEENIYIPSFISKRPFYAGEESDQTSDYLEHQRLQKKDDKATWYDRGKKAGPAATKFRKGACENCGAMTHKAKDCLERPRAKGAKYTGKNIQADEIVQDVKLGWDAKRDRWNGFDPKEYRAVVDDYNQMEELRKEQQAKRAAENGEEQEDGDHYADNVDMGKHQPTSTRQLRIREDTAKYLLNLDLDSAKYDPKTRSIVDGGATTDDKAAKLFAEEGFLKASGEAAEFEKAQKYAWETQEKSGDTSLHLQANPTAGEYHRRKEKEAAEKKQQEHMQMLLDRYGSAADTIPAALKDMTVTESERFVEYDEVGLIKGAPKSIARSKYPEDVFINNHTTVWGSWWSNFSWGYACCHSFVKNSYCTGEDGIRALEEAERHRTGVNLAEAQESGEVAQEEEAAGADSKTSRLTAKKRTMEEMLAGVSETELEEYRRKRTAADDPMAKYLGKDELVH
jgi:pre-mRNA-processing factor SLU7